ncbi:MAG TPA: hypothetical protein DGK91_09790 [Clostridium sp.]|jgi:hypothetical protein|nr:hypothetical protein [Clostridium sp.]
MGTTTIVSDFTSHGKESQGFYDNVEKIKRWRERYNTPQGVEELFDILNHYGRANTYCPERAYFVAYVLSSEGYKVKVITG